MRKLVFRELKQFTFRNNTASHIFMTAAMKLKDTYSLEEKLMTNLDSIFKSRDRGRSQGGGGVGRGEHFLPHKFIKRAFKRRVNSTKQLLNASRGHQAPRKATQVFKRR